MVVQRGGDDRRIFSSQHALYDGGKSDGGWRGCGVGDADDRWVVVYLV